MRKKKENQLMEKIIKTEDMKTAFHVEESLRKSFGCIINAMLELEMDEHLGNEKYKHMDEKQENYRNGYSKKKVKASIGDVEIDIPRDRNAEFNSVILPKYTRDIFELETKIMELYKDGDTRKNIKKFVESLYGPGISKDFVNSMIDKILPVIEELKIRRLDEVYPFVFIDTIQINVYVVLGISKTGMKEILGIYIGESSKLWLQVLKDIKRRGVKDILSISSEEFSGLQESIKKVYPKVEYAKLS